MLSFRGIHADILRDTTLERDVEGARDSGKTTVCVYHEIQQLVQIPKLKSFLFRYSDQDTQQKLVPFVREMAQDEFQQAVEWDAKEYCFTFPNGSIAYMFGLRAQSAAQRYSKMRGLGVGRVFAEQAEELPQDIGLELRAALRQPGVRYQLTYCANPADHNHWLTRQFPVDGRHKNRKLFQLSIYDNAHNLSAESIENLERTYPPEHPKHRTIILGQRGVNVMGEPVYGKHFQPALHVKPLRYNPHLPLIEAFDFGQLNPCWIIGQRPHSGGWHWLGGIIGLDLFLEDFLPIVKTRRAEWFPGVPDEAFKTCCTLSSSQTDAQHAISIEHFHEAGFHPTWTSGSNSPDVVLSLIERQASYLKRRGSTGQEMLLVNAAPDRWLKASMEGVDPSPFMAEAYGGGYAWSEKKVSVGRNELKQPEPDQWFEFPMRCAEAAELNFSVGVLTDEAKAAKRQTTAVDTTPRTELSWMVL